MLDRPITEIIHQAQAGNQAERDCLIHHYRSFVIRAVSHVCKRQIGWNHDEASIGLIALNEAIDRFNDTSGKSFDNFAYMLIRHRLVDEFRRQGKYIQMESTIWDGADEEFAVTSIEVAGSMELYDREQSAQALAEELCVYDEMLQQYGIALEELEDYSPKHRDTRKQLIQMAQTFCQYPLWLTTLMTTKRLPAKEMMSVFKVSSKTLERNRKYLIALILIYSCNEFNRIKNTVSFSEVEEK